MRESRGKAYIEGQREAGTRVYRLWKEARSRTTKGVQGGRLTLWDNRKLGLGVLDLGQMVL